MTWEENREFSADQHRIVKPLADHFVGVGLDYWQLVGKDKQAGPFLRKHGVKGVDTSGQFIVSPSGERLGESGRCWKNRCGYTPKELEDYAARFPAAAKNRQLLRLSWFLMDPAWYRKDIEDDGAWQRFCTDVEQLTQARERRRPMIRVDGPALEALENHQEFLTRHLRQFWWQKGDPRAPARIVVFNSHDILAEGEATVGQFPKGRVPATLAVVDLAGGVDLAKVTPILDECWRKYMAKRPDNIKRHKGNSSYRTDTEVAFVGVDETIRKLAEQGRLLAPGGRPLAK